MNPADGVIPSALLHRDIMKNRLYAALLAAIFVSAGISGCQKKSDDAGTLGPAEKAGAQIDSAAEKAGEQMHKAGEKVGQTLQEGGKKLEEKSQDAKQEEKPQEPQKKE